MRISRPRESVAWQGLFGGILFSISSRSYFFIFDKCTCSAMKKGSAESLTQRTGVKDEVEFLFARSFGSSALPLHPSGRGGAPPFLLGRRKAEKG